MKQVMAKDNKKRMHVGVCFPASSPTVSGRTCRQHLFSSSCHRGGRSSLPPHQDVLALLSHSLHSSLLRSGSLIHQISVFAHLFVSWERKCMFSTLHRNPYLAKKYLLIEIRKINQWRLVVGDIFKYRMPHSIFKLYTLWKMYRLLKSYIII